VPEPPPEPEASTLSKPFALAWEMVDFSSEVLNQAAPTSADGQRYMRAMRSSAEPGSNMRSAR
jgi:hypothetical protein